MKTIREALTRFEHAFVGIGIETARSDAEWLVAHAVAISRSDLYRYSDQALSEHNLEILDDILQRRCHYEPVQYITGIAGFYDKELRVGPGVLIPRPETERLVEIAGDLYIGRGDVLDLCTGSGAIPLALSGMLPARLLIGVDISFQSVFWAIRNLRKYPDQRISFFVGDLMRPLGSKKFEIITANPPYVSDNEFLKLPETVRKFEPESALRAGLDGLSVIIEIANQAREFLIDGGWLICEIGERQGRMASEIFRVSGYTNVRILRDYNDRDRVVVGQASRRHVG